MYVRSWSIATLSTLALQASSAGALPTPEATPPDFLVLRSYCAPTFVVDQISRPEGTGFLVERLGTARKTYLLTAQHLFPQSSAALPSHVTSARCEPNASRRSYKTGAALTIPGAHPMGALSQLRDVAAFPVIGWSPGLSLAAVNVRPGDPVWLLARVKSGRETGTLLHRAVVGRANGFLAYRFDDQSIGLDQTSGGAVLNRDGDVVGLNIGYGRLPNGSLFGVGDSLDTLRSVVADLP